MPRVELCPGCQRPMRLNVDGCELADTPMDRETWRCACGVRLVIEDEREVFYPQDYERGES